MVHSLLLYFCRYIQKTHDLDGLQLLPIFIANRAIIRAKVACAEMSTHQDEQEILKHLKLRFTHTFAH